MRMFRPLSVQPWIPSRTVPNQHIEYKHIEARFSWKSSRPSESATSIQRCVRHKMVGEVSATVLSGEDKILTTIPASAKIFPGYYVVIAIT